ncbi:hypothetical protein WDW37_14570 [Bdellovibrionota bacterium FG-1]
MKGLIQIPSEQDLLGAYEKLQFQKAPIFSGELILWSQWSRFDPRLAEQLISYFKKEWKTLLPTDLNAHLLKTAWPAALGVLLSHLQEFGEFQKKDEALFSNWANCVMTDIPCAKHEQFFIGLRSLGGKLMREDAEQSIKPYNKWGYLGREVLINKASQNISTLNSKKTWIPRRARLAVLDGLLENRSRITVREYREKLHHSVSLRQAEMDLKENPRLKPFGNTRARHYLVKKERKKKV